MNEKKTAIKHFQLRLPESLMDWLRERSHRADRSMNAEIKRILKTAQIAEGAEA